MHTVVDLKTYYPNNVHKSLNNSSKVIATQRGPRNLIIYLPNHTINRSILRINSRINGVRINLKRSN